VPYNLLDRAVLASSISSLDDNEDLLPSLDNAAMQFHRFDADSARLFRSYLARDSEMISPTVPISDRPEARSFQHVDFSTPL
jgi:hypothetical protein